MKERFLKRYRHPTLDKELVARRLVAEARTMVRGRKYGVDCPVLYFVDRDDRKLYMEYVDGISLKEFLDQKRVSASALHTGDSTDQPKQTVCHFSGNVQQGCWPFVEHKRIIVLFSYIFRKRINASTDYRTTNSPASQQWHHTRGFDSVKHYAAQFKRRSKYN